MNKTVLRHLLNDKFVSELLGKYPELEIAALENILRFARDLTHETEVLLYKKVGDFGSLTNLFVKRDLSSKTVDYLLTHSKGFILQEILKTKDISDEVLHKRLDELTGIDTHNRRIILSSKIHTPKLLKHYVVNGNLDDRCFIVSNPNLTKDLLDILVNDHYSPVRRIAVDRLKAKTYKT